MEVIDVGVAEGVGDFGDCHGGFGEEFFGSVDAAFDEVTGGGGAGVGAEAFVELGEGEAGLAGEAMGSPIGGGVGAHLEADVAEVVVDGVEGRGGGGAGEIGEEGGELDLGPAVGGLVEVGALGEILEAGEIGAVDAVGNAPGEPGAGGGGEVGGEDAEGLGGVVRTAYGISGTEEDAEAAGDGNFEVVDEEGALPGEDDPEIEIHKGGAFPAPVFFADVQGGRADKAEPGGELVPGHERKVQ